MINPESPQEYAERTRPVTIVNTSTETYERQWNGQWYRIHGAHEDGRAAIKQVPTEVAWHWFGDRRLLATKEANKEVQRTFDSCGGFEGTWAKALRAGTLYVMEWGKLDLSTVVEQPKIIYDDHVSFLTPQQLQAAATQGGLGYMSMDELNAAQNATMALVGAEASPAVFASDDGKMTSTRGKAAPFDAGTLKQGWTKGK